MKHYIDQHEIDMVRKCFDKRKISYTCYTDGIYYVIATEGYDITKEKEAIREAYKNNLRK